MGLESQNLKELTGYIEEAFSEYMTFPTILFIVAIVVALSSIACFILAPFYIKGKARGAKTAAQVISVIDFIVGILLIFAFLIITLLLNIASDGFFDSADDFLKAVFGFLIVPTRFGMSPLSVFGSEAGIGTPILFYALYFVTAGLLGLAAFIVSCIARGKYNAANGLIRGAAAPVGAPQYNPYQPYGQPNIPQGYPQQYGQNAQQGYPQQYGQNAQQGYPQQYGQNIPQGYPQQYQQNIPQDNAQYQPARQEVPQNIPQDNAQYQPARQEVPQNIPQDNAQYQPARQEAPQNIPQDNAQYQPAQQDAPQNIPQETANAEAPVQADVAQAAPVQQASSAFCGNCGSPVTPGASFCQNCGNKIS
ncbi:MAG: zinc ribbon domain-containing protein [Ruminiclostridium sp.]|nr:zinc ribbon domain-containing protein [Ruminiclostridium sp.]